MRRKAKKRVGFTHEKWNSNGGGTNEWINQSWKATFSMKKYEKVLAVSCLKWSITDSTISAIWEIMALMSLWFQTKSLRSSFFSVKKKNGTFHPYFLYQSNIDHCGPFECFYKSNKHVIAIKILTTPLFPFLSLLIYVLHYLVLLKTQNTAITCLNSFLLEIPVLVNRVCSFDLRTIRTPNHTFQLLVLIS